MKKKIFVFIILVLLGLLIFDYISYRKNVYIDKSYEIVKEDVKKNIDPNLLRDYKLDKLKQKNQDLWGWVYIPNSPIDRYVMKEPVFNVYKYLWRDIDNQFNRFGSFFIPGDPLDEDGNKKHSDVIEIMGHNLAVLYNNPPMFSHLSKMYLNEEDALNNRFVYTYKDGVATKWEFWMSSYVNQSDRIFQIPYTKGCPCYKEILDHMESIQRFSIAKRPNYKYEETLVLSTCKHAMEGDTERFIALFVPVESYNQKTKEYIGYRKD